MTKNIKLVATLAILLIAATGVMTFEACNKKDKGSVEPAVQNNRKPLATFDHNHGTMTYSFDLDKINADLNRSLSRTAEDRYIVESIEILDDAPTDAEVCPEIKIVVLDTEEEASGTVWLMKKFSQKVVEEDRTYYNIDKSVSIGDYDFAYRDNDRLIVVKVNGNTISTHEEDVTIIDSLPKWLLFCKSCNCAECTKNGSFWNAGCNPCETPGGTCTSELAEWVIPVVTTLLTILLA